MCHEPMSEEAWRKWALEYRSEHGEVSLPDKKLVDGTLRRAVMLPGGTAIIEDRRSKKVKRYEVKLV